jgi:hypothetical protein
MTQQEIETKFYEIGYALDAIDIITESLANISLNDVWSEKEHEDAYRKFLKIGTQIEMIKGFTEKARTSVDGIEKVVIDRID